MKTLVLKISISIIGLSLLTACAYVPKLGNILPDKKTEYKKSKSLPDLEIPPDLTADAINDSMSIPDETPVTLSRYKNPRAPRKLKADTGTGETDEQWLSLLGPKEELWPELREFFKSRDYPIEVDDENLGVMETGWSQASGQFGMINRYKYRIFSKSGDNPDTTILFISQQRQTRRDDTNEWVDQDKDADLERQLVSDLGMFVSADQPAMQLPLVTAADEPVQDAGSTSRVEASGKPQVLDAGSTSRVEASGKPQVLNAGDGKLYLTIPEEFERAWKHTEIALQNTGLQIVGKDSTRGLYLINYPGNEPKEKRGLFSRPAFWKGGKSEEMLYQLSLTGVGNTTELIVLDENGDWETADEAARILALIRGRYPAN